MKLSLMRKVINYPTLEEIIEINKRLGEGGILVNKSNLEFIIDKAKNVKGIVRKATTFLYDIIRLHPFLDGNKRTSFHTMLYFLELNGVRFKYGHEDESKIEKLLNRIARRIEKREEVEKWIEGGIR
jgi:death-on-curing family protein